MRGAPDHEQKQLQRSGQQRSRIASNGIGSETCNYAGIEALQIQKGQEIMIQQDIRKLTAYGLQTGLIEKEDEIYTLNRLLELFELEELEETEDVSMEEEELEAVLGRMMDYACEKGIMEEDGIVYRDLFDTKIMSVLVPRPSEVVSRFRDLYAQDPVKATDYYYKLSQDTDYIRRYRIKKDQKWIAATEFGDLDITINLSKPEKDPKAIAAARNAKQSGYPKCLLCVENE